MTKKIGDWWKRVMRKKTPTTSRKFDIVREEAM